MKSKRFITCFMLLVSLLMLAVPLVPHHHHANGIICLKNDIADHSPCNDHQECTTHQTHDHSSACAGHHHPENDACCSDDCLTRIHTSVPASQTDLPQPQLGFIALLFTDYIIENILKPREQRIKNYYVYRESLHGTNITRAFSLRGPPCLFV